MKTENKLTASPPSGEESCYADKIKACQNCIASVMPEDDFCYSCGKSRNYVRPKELNSKRAIKIGEKWWEEKGRAISNCDSKEGDESLKRLISSFAHDLHERGMLKAGDPTSPV